MKMNIDSDDNLATELARIRADLQRASTPMLEFARLHQATLQHLATQTETFRNALKASAPAWSQQMQAMRQIAQSVGLMGSQLRDIAKVIQQADIDRQWRQLSPAFGNLSRYFADTAGLRAAISAWAIKLHQADKVLTDHGFGWSSEALPLDFVAGFSAVGPPAQGAAVTNMMRAQTARPEFREYLHQLVGGSQLLAPRWKVLGPALDAHVARNYVLSIPALTAQAEGILTQLLVMRRLARRKGKKLFALDPATQRVRLNRKRQPILLSGLHDKVQHSDLNNDPILRTLVDVLLDSFISDRNGVMHGGVTTYGTAKRSTQAVLMVAVLAAQVSAVETGRQSKAAA